MANRDTVLMAVLECGTLDMSVLDDVQYDLDEIVDELFAEGLRPSLNLIMQEVFRKAVEEMADFVEQEIDATTEVQKNASDCEWAVYLNEKLGALRQLNPLEDIDYYCNCLDTSVYFVKNEDLYREYLPEAVEAIERHTGFSL